MALGTSPATVTTAATWIPEIWAEELRAFREKNLVAAQVVKRYPFEGSVGDTIHVPDLSRLTVVTASEGGDDANSVATESEFSGTITRHRLVRVQVPDRVNIQSKYNLRAAYTASAGKSIAEDLDTHILSLESGFQGGSRKIGSDGSTAYAATSAGNGADIADAGLRRAIETLDVANVPFDGRFLIANPRQKNVMLGIARFVEYQSIGHGNMPIRTGLFGEIYGIPVYFTTNTAVLTAADTTTLHDANILGQMDCLLLAMQQDIRVQMDYILQNLSWLIAVDYIGQCFEFRDDHAVTLVTPQA
jgi:N4-gp56 family major capsid protein